MSVSCFCAVTIGLSHCRRRAWVGPNPTVDQLIRALDALQPARGLNRKNDPQYRVDALAICNLTTNALYALLDQVRESSDRGRNVDSDEDESILRSQLDLLTDGGRVVSDKCRQDRGMALLTETVQLKRKFYGGTEAHPSVLESMTQLAIAMETARRWEEAFMLFQKIVDINKAMLRRQEESNSSSVIVIRDTAKSLMLLGSVLCNHSRGHEGLPCWRRLWSWSVNC